jgi:hypothetical protein
MLAQTHKKKDIGKYIKKGKKKSFGVSHDIVACLFCYNFTAAKILQ